MKVPKYLKFSKIEIIFLLVAVMTFIVGTAIAVCASLPGLMPGVGAMIIVLGVCFAFYEIPNIFTIYSERMHRLRRVLAVSSRITAIEEETRSHVSEDERKRITEEEEKRIDDTLADRESKMRKRFHLVELFIVCFGTLVNGFGQIVLEWYLRCA